MTISAAGKTKADDISEETEGAREKAFQAYSAARRKAAETVESAREGVRKAGQRTIGGVDDAPVAALLGALAIGALAGALLPASRREADMLGPLGGKITDAGKTAFSAAREAGRETLGEFGVNKEAAQGQFDKVLDIAVKTILSAGDAAAKARRE